MTPLPRALAAVVTPFRRGVFDAGVLQTHLRFLEEGGLDGVLSLGSTGEFPSLAHEEKKAVLSATLRARGRLQVIAQVGSTAQPEVLELARLAEDEGACALLVPPPYYYKAVTVAGLADFFGPLIERTRLPVLLYHFPQLTGVPVTEELIRALDGRVRGLKDSSGDPKSPARFLAADPELRILIGNDHVLAAGLEAGAWGGMHAVANVFPAQVAAVVRSAGGERAQAQARLGRARALLERYPVPAGAKRLLEHLGLGAAEVRPPLRALEAAQAEALVREYRELQEEPGRS
jgi:4-hydroxy-tetrahydrodipicolinate synthase